MKIYTEDLNQVEQPVQDKEQRGYTPQELSQAKKLCIFSICFGAAGFIADIVILFGLLETSNTDMVLVLFEAVKIVGLILMIVCRAKYPKYIFAKVLMWVYIALFVMQFIFLFYCVMVIVTCLNSCSNFY